MLVYLVHPKHGTHIAYSPLEVEKCKANGWVERDAVPPKTETTLHLPKKRGRPKKVD